MEMFSRNFNIVHFATALKIFTELRTKGYAGKLPLVTTWELYDKAWSFPRVRFYDVVE